MMIRRKKVIYFIYAVLTFSSANAQSYKLGLTAGFNVSQYDGDGYGGYNKLGMNFGGVLNFPVSKKLQTQLELKYVQKGAKHNPNPNAGDYRQYSLKMNYIELPVLMRYLYKNVYIDAGVGIGTLMRYNEEVDYNPVTNGRPFNKLEFTWQFGLAMKLAKNIELNARYSYSLLPVRKYPAGFTYNLGLGENNNVILFSINYFFTKK